MKRRLDIGTVDDLFREDEDEMRDEDDMYISLAAEQNDKLSDCLDDKDDQFLVNAAENYEKSVKANNLNRPLPNSAPEIEKMEFNVFVWPPVLLKKLSMMQRWLRKCWNVY